MTWLEVSPRRGVRGRVSVIGDGRRHPAATVLSGTPGYGRDEDA